MSSTTSSPAGSSRIEPAVMRVAIVVILGAIMSVLDTTIVNVALHDLSIDLHASLGSIQWVITGYLLSLAAVIPVTGWAVRRYSARRLYLIALVVFTLGSALCALATTSSELIAFRVIQGIGGGMITPIGQMILVKASGPRNLPKVMSFIGVPIVLAPVFGPTLGGLLLQTVGWQWIFLINAPVGILAFTLAWRLLPHDEASSEKAGRLDVLGLVLAAAGVVGITYGLSESEGAGSFTAPSVLGPVLAGIVLLGLFILRSRRTTHPLLDLTLFRNPAFRAASIVTFCLGAALFGAMILMPLYFQTVRGQDAIDTGLLLIPQGLGGGLGMFLSGRFTQRLGAGRTSLIGGIILAVATVPFVLVTAHTPFPAIGAAMLVRGVGVGLAIMPAMTAAFSVLTREQVNDASPQLTVLQRVGGSLGTAVIAVVLEGHTKTAHTQAALAHAFGQTYWWVLGVTLVGLAPTVLLMRIERRARRQQTAEILPEEAPLLEGGMTGDDGRRAEIEELRAALAHMSGAERRLRGRDHSRPGELTFAQIRALAALGREREMTAGQLARSADLNPATVTAMLDHLEAAGIVERHRSTTDRRVCNVSLTDDGWGLLEQKLDAWQRRWEEKLADVSDGDLQTAARVVGQVTELYDEIVLRLDATGSDGPAPQATADSRR